MISKMRELAPTIMIIVLVAFVVGTIFFNWGMNAGGSKNRLSMVGSINGQEIPLSAFDRQVNEERQKLQERGEIPEYQSHMIPRQVWEEQVQAVLTQDAIKKLHLDATADEVFEYIKKNPLPGIDTASVFKTNGVFDTSKYVQFLNNPQNYDTYPWLRNIEEYTRQMIIPSQKLQVLVGAGVLPSRAEVEYEHEQSQSKVAFEYVKVNNFLQRIDSSKITNAAIEKFYNAHRDSFYRDNQIDLYYAKFSKRATANDEKTYLQQLKEIKQKVLASGKIAETFAEEAKVESDDDGSAQNGGDLGWFTKGQMVPEFDAVAFSLDTGKISDPIRTQFGYHLIYVENREKKDTTVRVKARHILKKIVPTVETIDSLSAQADSLRNLMTDKGFLQAAKSFPGVEVDSTGLFKKGDMIPKIGYISGAGQFAFSNNEKNNISERLENNDGFYLISVKQRTKKGVLPLNLVREKVIAMLSDSLRKEASKEYLNALKGKFADTTSLAALKNNDPKLMSDKSDTVTLNGFVRGIGPASKIAAVAYIFPIGKISHPIEYNGSYYLIKTLWKQPAAKIDWNSPEAKQLVEQIRMKNLQRTYYQWFLFCKNKAKIVSNVDDIYLD